jgi:hypothetical protein
VSYTKSQIQEKEKELKREYRMLKDARMQSGVEWNATRSMIEAEDALWDNLIISFPQIHKFKTKSFPLFDALRELYDGQIAEGTYNVNSTQLPQHMNLQKLIIKKSSLIEMLRFQVLKRVGHTLYKKMQI